VASLMRCASPPESDSALRFSVRYSSPTSMRKRSRSRTSFSTGPAMSASSPGCPGARSGIERTKSFASLTESSPNSPMFLPAIVTASDSGLSRIPLHSGQTATTMYSSSSLRTESLVVSL